MMKYQKYHQGTWHFPKPKVPALPTLGLDSLKLSRQASTGALAHAPDTRFYSRSRYALTVAYRMCGVGARGALLAPAYHCRTMLDPAIRLGAEIGFYPLRPDLTPDPEGLKASLASCNTPAAAMLVTHFFGFSQELEALLSFCDSHGIALIEDCSHCLIARPVSDHLGRQGRYSVWSPYKFFPCEDGGILLANHDAAMPSEQRRSPGIVDEFKGFAHLLQRSWASRSALKSSRLDKKIDSLRIGTNSVSQDLPHNSAMPSTQYDVALEDVENLAGSRWIMHHTDIARLVERRRQNYLQWAQAMTGLPHCHALFPSLPDDCVPYMFPLYIDHPDAHFLALKCLGMTEWRWDDMAISPCRIATDYRLHMLHLPCHQELTSNQMTWMTSAVTKVLTQVPLEIFS